MINKEGNVPLTPTPLHTIRTAPTPDYKTVWCLPDSPTKSKQCFESPGCASEAVSAQGSGRQTDLLFFIDAELSRWLHLEAYPKLNPESNLSQHGRVLDAPDSCGTLCACSVRWRPWIWLPGATRSLCTPRISCTKGRCRRVWPDRNICHTQSHNVCTKPISIIDIRDQKMHWPITEPRWNNQSSLAFYERQKICSESQSKRLTVAYSRMRPKNIHKAAPAPYLSDIYNICQYARINIPNSISTKYFIGSEPQTIRPIGISCLLWQPTIFEPIKTPPCFMQRDVTKKCTKSGYPRYLFTHSQMYRKQSKQKYNINVKRCERTNQNTDTSERNTLMHPNRATTNSCRTYMIQTACSKDLISREHQAIRPIKLFIYIYESC